jgi:hypothetical protein
MTVDEVLSAIGQGFPAFNSKALGVWGPIFHSALGRREGEALARLHAEVLVDFSPTGRRIPYPVVSDYLAKTPDPHREASRAAGGKALDRHGHGDRMRRLMADWKARQGQRLSNGVPQVMSALEQKASSIANLAAWKSTTPEPVTLNAEEIRIALHCAISQERRDRFGPLHRTSAALWWQQIIDVSRGWGFDADWDDWRVRERQPEPMPPSDDEIPLGD